MNFQQVSKAVKNVFEMMYDAVFGDLKYAKQTAFAALAAGLIAAGYYGHRWYRVNQEQSAQQLFSHNVEEFERALEEGKKDDWANVESLFKLGYDQYSHSALAPFFLIYQAQAMLKQGKSTQAFQTIDTAVQQMSADSPLADVYKASIALMRIDSNDKETQEAGISQLQALADTPLSTGFDIASYYLGLYYMTQNNENKAKEIWQKLIDSQKDQPKMGQSPWAKLAQQKLGMEIE
jgi:tetratricopeptide (TPR) repeat protein